MAFGYFYREQADQFTFFRIPKALFADERFKSMSTDAKVLYGLMLDRVSLSVRNKWVDEQDRVYIIFSLQDIMEEMNCANQKASKILSELDKVLLIERKRLGLGKPDIIYVKNFASEEKTLNHENHETENHENHDSGLMNTMTSKSRKSHTNKTNQNKTKYNHTYPFASLQGEKNRTEEKEFLSNFFWEKLQIEELIADNPCAALKIREIYDVLVDTLCSGKSSIRISGSDRPRTEVREQFMKLDAAHIEYVLHSIDENTTSIRNIKQYLLAVLYNAPMTMDHYYSAKASHDMNGGKK